MSEHSLIKTIAVLGMAVFIVPAAFFTAPQKAVAAGTGCVGGVLGGIIASAFGDVPATSKSGNVINGVTAGTTMGTCINDVILIPLARAAIRTMLQTMTQDTINFINGSNGTGQPSYVRNTSEYLRSVGDVVALSFIGQITNRAFGDSPFSSALAGALQTEYVTRSSLEGFFAANRCTLNASINYFLTGNWAQGGVASWFDLTTQTQNNPYMIYQASLGQLVNNLNQENMNRRQDLVQSSGFISWCGAGTTVNPNATSSTAVSPQAPCINADGTPAKASTPGSVIHDYTSKLVTSAGVDTLISSTDLDAAFGSIVTALLTKVIGGAGGLFGASTGVAMSAGSPPLTYTGNSASATGSAYQSAQVVLTGITSYTTAWNTIATAAQSASTSVQSLQSFCTSAAAASSNPTFAVSATAQATAAQAVLTSEIAPVLAQAQAALATAATTKTFGTQVQSEAVTGAAGTTLASDVATLVAMPPSVVDITNAQSNATATGGSIAKPAGSLTVTGGSLVDQMILLSTNAEALKASACTPTAPTAVP